MRLINFLILIAFASVVISSCNDGSNGSNLGNNVLASDQFLAASIGNDSLSVVDGVGGFLNRAGSGGGVIDTAGNYLQREFTEYTNNSDYLRIYFIELFTDTPTTQQISDMVEIGSYTYGHGSSNAFANDTVIPGVAIVYSRSGTSWSTEYNPQNNATFTIDSVWTNTLDASSKYFAKGVFSCTVYSSLGDSISVENGSFSGKVIF